MFDPERLLGQLMGDALSGRLGGRGRRDRGAGGLGALLGGGRMSTGTKAQLGLGLIGIAVAAFQHYSQSSSPAATPAPLAGAAMPPPPPAAGPTMPPPPPPAAAPARSEHAMLLLRAMITAAHADGLIDGEERGAIVGRARAAGLDDDTLRTLEAEIRAPLTLDQLAARTPPDLRDEVYAAALIAITADTDAERAFLDRLAAAVGLADDARRDVHRQLGLA